MMSNKDISSQLRRRRLELGLSLADVARRAGTSIPSLSRYETGWHRFEIGTLRKLATALDADLALSLIPRVTGTQKPWGSAQAIDRLARLFWDHPLSESDFERHPVWITERVLAYGRLEDVRTVRDFLGRNQFLDAVAEARFSSSKTRNFWERVLEMEGRSCTRVFSRATVWTS